MHECAIKEFTSQLDRCRCWDTEPVQEVNGTLAMRSGVEAPPFLGIYTWPPFILATPWEGHCHHSHFIIIQIKHSQQQSQDYNPSDRQHTERCFLESNIEQNTTKQTKSYDLIYSSLKSGKTKPHLKGEQQFALGRERGGGQEELGGCGILWNCSSHEGQAATVHTGMNLQTWYRKRMYFTLNFVFIKKKVNKGM